MHTHTPTRTAWLILQLNKKLEINHRHCLKYRLQGFDVSATTQGLYVGRAGVWILTAVYSNTTNQPAMHRKNVWYILSHLKQSSVSWTLPSQRASLHASASDSLSALLTCCVYSLAAPPALIFINAPQSCFHPLSARWRESYIFMWLCIMYCTRDTWIRLTVKL